MLHNRSRWLALGVAALMLFMLAACAPIAQPSGGAATEPVSLAFWNMPFVTQEVSPDYVVQWEQDVKTALPNIAVDNFCGPGEYKPQRDKYANSGFSRRFSGWF